jgi:isopentenyldiphosphate isomerase
MTVQPPSAHNEVVDAERLVVIVNEADEPVGVAMRSDMRAKNLLHRCTAVLVLSTDGKQLLVHQRADSKSFWPGWWDLVAGGVVEAGEDLTEAAQRELQEELGIDASLTKLGSGRLTNHELDVFMHVWIARHDGPFHFTDGEVQQVGWLNQTELEAHLVSEERNWCIDSKAVALPLLRSYESHWAGAPS